MSVRVRNTKPPTQQQLEEHAKEEQRRLNIVTECLARFNEEEWNRKVKIATAGLANIKIPKLTAKELVVLSKVFPSEKKVEKVEKKKPIPFIIESDSEEESDEESDEKQDECCGCGEKFYWRMLNYSSDDKGTLYCDDCMPESDDEEE